MLGAICQLVKEIPIDIEWHWVKGHQDNNTLFSALDFWARRNILCDGLAKLYWNASNSQLETTAIEDSFPMIQVQEEVLTHFDKNALYSKLTKCKTMNYWSRRTSMESSTLNEIDWSICHIAYKALRFSK